MSLLQTIGGRLGRWSRDDLYRAGMFLMLLNLAGNVLTMLTRLVLGRLLTTVQYGEMEAIAQVVGFFSIPVGATQVALTLFVARAIAKARSDEAGAILWRAGRRLSIYAGAILVLLVLSAPLLKAFFHLRSSWPVFAGAAVFFASLAWVVSAGGLQGMQHFRLFAVAGAIGAGSRILFSWILIRPGFGATGALAAQAASILLCAMLSLPLIWRLLGQRSTGRVDTLPVYRFLWPMMATMGVCSVLGTVDMVIVKHFFAPEEAGVYARAMAVGRTVTYLNGALLTVLLPRVAAESVTGGKPLHMLWKTLGLGMVITVAGALICTFWPALPILVLHGKGHQELTPYVRGIVWALLPSAAAAFAMQYLTARQDFRFLLPLTPVAVFIAASLWLFHPSLGAVIGMVAGGGILMLGVLVPGIWQEWKGRGT